MTTLLSFIGVNKWIQYAIVAFISLSLLAVAYQRTKATGAKLEKLKALEQRLQASSKEQKIRAEIESASSAVVRQRLRQRWLSR